MREITVQCRKPGGEWHFLNHFTAEHTLISEVTGEAAREAAYDRLRAAAESVAGQWRTNYPNFDDYEIRVFDSAVVAPSIGPRAPAHAAPKRAVVDGGVILGQAAEQPLRSLQHDLGGSGSSTRMSPAISGDTASASRHHRMPLRPRP